LNIFNDFNAAAGLTLISKTVDVINKVFDQLEHLRVCSSNKKVEAIARDCWGRDFRDFEWDFERT